MNLISSADRLPPALAASLSATERELIGAPRSFPFAVTPHFASLAKPERNDPIRRQFMPDEREALYDPSSRDDPLGEALHRVTAHLVDQYGDRVLLFAGGRCAGHCRYCFRKNRIPAAFINDEELEPVLNYIRSRPGIREILVSGGDPLSADDGELSKLFEKLRQAGPGMAIRLCSRIPITEPERIGPGTVKLLAGIKGLRLSTHINHPAELAPVTREVLSKLVNEKIPVLVQTVLLRGVNDSAETLAELFLKCRDLGLTPYYLFQIDLAPGTAHFRVPLKEGLSIYNSLKRIADFPLPAYAVDLPGGGGKIRLSEDVIAGEAERPGGRVHLLKDPGGKLWEYPVI